MATTQREKSRSKKTAKRKATKPKARSTTRRLSATKKKTAGRSGKPKKKVVARKSRASKGHKAKSVTLKDGTVRAEHATVATVQKRIDHCAYLLSIGKTNWQIRSIISEQFGIAPYTVLRRYIPAARARVLQDGGISRNDLRAHALAFYRSVVANEAVPVHERLRAQKQLDRLMGLPMPVRVDITTGGKEIKGYVGINLDEV